MKRALNCWPWVRSLTQSPEAVIHSPAEIVAAWPTMVARSRCPRAFTRSTQKPVSTLWNVTRSTMPASTSRSVCVAGDGMAMGRIIPHTPCVWRARVRWGRAGLAARGSRRKVRSLRPGQDGGKGIPTFRLRNQARALKCQPKKACRVNRPSPKLRRQIGIRREIYRIVPLSNPQA